MIMHFTTFSLITYLAEIPSVTLVSISNTWDFTAAVWVTYFIADGNKLLRELPDRPMLLNDSFFCAEKLAHFIEHLPSFGHLPIVCSTQYCIQNFFGLVDSLFAKGKVLKIYLSRLAQNAFLGAFPTQLLQVISIIFFDQISCFWADTISNIALVIKGLKILIHGFLVRLGENFLRFFLLLIGSIFLGGKHKQIILWQQFIFLPVTFFWLFLI